MLITQHCTALLTSVVLDARSVFEHRSGTRHHPGLRLAPQKAGLGDVLGAGALQWHPGVEETSLLEDESPALGKTDIHCSPGVGSCAGSFNFNGNNIERSQRDLRYEYSF